MTSKLAVCVLILGAAACLFGGVARAQEKGDILRVEYLPSDDKPPHVLFALFLEALTQANENDPEFAIGLVYANFKPVSVEDAQALLSKLLEASDSIELGEREANTLLVCPTDRPLPVGEAVYEALDGRDDLFEAVYQDQYLEVRNRLTAPERRQLEAFLIRNQSATYYAKYDHRKTFESQGIDPDAEIQRICEQETQ